MAYDRYVAICNPLNYVTEMNREACIKMVTCAWIFGFFDATLNTACTFAITFCSNSINQFFCEIPQLLKLSCSNSYDVELGALAFTIYLNLGGKSSISCLQQLPPILTEETPLRYMNSRAKTNDIFDLGLCILYQKMFNETFFLLLGFSDIRELQILHFVVFLLIYLTTVMGNLLIIILVTFNHQLHTPMYFFLMNLSMADIGNISVNIPKAMSNSIMNTRLISYPECVSQVFFLIFFAMTDLLLLTFMAYDRYIAICNPLRYETMMNRGACIQMAASAWITGISCAVLHTGGTFSITFCSNVINQFFCEIPHLLKLSCNGNFLAEDGVNVFAACVAFGCFIFIMFSYVQIVTSVLRIPSIQGRKKALSTCLPHLIVVSLFIGTGTLAYLCPTSEAPKDLIMLISVLYSMLPPMMNPIIYSMRNKEIRSAMSKCFGRNLCSKQQMKFILK
ncbi:olfactory receptor 14A16-like [Elgaria multicarinata webbii]|uniref:olfactory receptor 14A16-like n=1 Tax=Elgaria multicarinata webbii TaxID=159646 RepID=UPI002FCD0BF3